MLWLLVNLPDKNALDKLLDSPKLNGAVVSATVTDLDGNVLYEKNSGIHVLPASNQKLFSNAFALWERGADYRPQTRFWKLSDRIVIDSTGDPLMTFDQLKHAQSQLGADRHLPVYVREAYAPQIPDGWDYDDLPNKYAAPVTAFGFDRNSFSIWSLGGRAALLPSSFGVRLSVDRKAGPLVTRYDPFLREVWVSGTLPKKDQVLDTLALPHPDEIAAKVFGARLEYTEDLPQREPDLVLTGGSVIDIVRACLPPSDNNLAENLLLLGARKEGELGPNPYPLACKRMKDFLVHVVGISEEDLHPFDGSGLSRRNYLTSRALAKLLCWANQQPTSAAWHSALAKSGTGTLSNRLKDVRFQGKTGSLAMVSSLSGYVTSLAGKTLIVSIVMNEFGCTADEVHAIQDEFTRILARD